MNYRSTMKVNESGRLEIGGCDCAALAEKYGKNAGQIILRFEVQDGIIVLPKSVNPERIAGNLNIFDFSLTEEEMDSLRCPSLYAFFLMMSSGTLAALPTLSRR